MIRQRMLLVPLFAVVLSGLVVGQDTGAKQAVNKKKAAGKQAAGKVLTQVLARDNKSKAWKPLRANAAVPFGALLVGGNGAALTNARGTVQLTLLGDLTGKSPFPILETAVILNPTKEKGVDLSFTLDRGRVDIVNKKKEGAARVRVAVQENQWEMTLTEPETHVAMELYGRWPRGVPFKKDAGPDHRPEMDLVVLTLTGHVDFRTESHQFRLSAPPGPALLQWDSVHGWDRTPTMQYKVPAWADTSAGDAEGGPVKRATLVKFRAAVLKNGLDKAVDEFLAADDPDQRRLAVMVLGATDNLDKLALVLNRAKHSDVWEAGVLVLRHWIGRGPGQDQRLYEKILEKRKLSPANAATILQLLHSFGDEDLQRPETYEVLIGYLSHEVMGIRGLAAWHLVRLVPAGRKIQFSPLDPPEARARAQGEWRKLIPPGQLPPRDKTNAAPSRKGER